MNVFLAGGSGVIGTRLVPLLVAAGHRVVAMTRSPAKTELLGRLGAEPVVCDVFDRPALETAVAAARPDLVMHQLTDLPDDAARIGGHQDANNRIRTEGTRNLVEAAAGADVGRLLAQSVAWVLPGAGGEAVALHERMVLDAGGLVVRYGQFHGPGTFHPETAPPPPRVHIDGAAGLTVGLLDHPPGVVMVTDEAVVEVSW